MCGPLAVPGRFADATRAHSGPVRGRLRLGGAVLVVCVGLALGGAVPGVAQEHRYDREYPQMEYLRSAGDNRVTRMWSALGATGLATVFASGQERVAPLLEHLEISETSQVMVFSKTSLQSEFITPETPRALYFNDDTYVAFVPGSGAIEVAAFDPSLGPVFYVLRPAGASVDLRRQNDQCLACHDSFSLTGGGVPRFLMGSGPTLATGDLASHGSWLLTSDRTSLARRWGGWYVTGRSGPSEHFGNNPMTEPTAPVVGGSLLHRVPEAVQSESYPTAHSDIVALLVLRHQLELQNLLTRLAWEAERGPAGGDPARQASRVRSALEAFADALVFERAASLPAPIEGASGFSEHFEALGPSDPQGRSLRQLDLGSRLFRFPLSYTIYSPALDALPRDTRSTLFELLVARLEALDTIVWPRDAGTEALEILEATHEGFAAWKRQRAG